MALADAVLALVLLTVASTVMYSTVAGVISSGSDARQRVELKETALEAGGMPLEASSPRASFVNLSSGEVIDLTNVTGEELIVAYLELLLHSNTTDDSYDLSGLLATLEALYGTALRGRDFAVFAHCRWSGMDMTIFMSRATGGTEPSTVEDVPHPRVVTQKVIFHRRGDVTVDLYIWR